MDSAAGFVPAKDLLKRTKSAVLWNAAGRAARVALQMLFVLFVGRILGPAEFGIVSLSLIPFQIATTLGTRTFSQALIQNKLWMRDLKREVWWSSVLSGLAVLLAITVSAGVYGYIKGSVDSFFVLSLMGLSAPISSLAVVSQARLSVELRFSKISTIETIASLLAVLLGLLHLLVYRNIYSVVTYALTQRIAETALMIVATRPDNGSEGAMVAADRPTIRPVVKFTAPIFGMNLLTTAIQSIDQLFVGLVIGTEALGLYGMARRITEQPARLIVQALERALFPAAVHALEDREKAPLIYANSIFAICLISGITFFPLAALAPYIVPLVLGPEWTKSVAFVQIFAIQSGILPVGSIFLSFITAAGATGKQLAFTITRFTTLFLATVVLAWWCSWNAIELAIAITIANMLLVYPNMLLAEKTAGVSSRVGMRSMAKGLFPGFFAGLLVFWIGKFDLGPLQHILLALMVCFAVLAICAVIVFKPLHRK